MINVHITLKFQRLIFLGYKLVNKNVKFKYNNIRYSHIYKHKYKQSKILINGGMMCFY